MSAHGWYVTAAYAATALCIALELWLLRRRARQARANAPRGGDAA
jgi:heme exporter protein CcmD